MTLGLIAAGWDYGWLVTVARVATIAGAARALYRLDREERANRVQARLDQSRVRWQHTNNEGAA